MWNLSGNLFSWKILALLGFDVCLVVCFVFVLHCVTQGKCVANQILPVGWEFEISDPVRLLHATGQVANGKRDICVYVVSDSVGDWSQASGFQFISTPVLPCCPITFILWPFLTLHWGPATSLNLRHSSIKSQIQGSLRGCGRAEQSHDFWRQEPAWRILNMAFLYTQP